VEALKTLQASLPPNTSQVSDRHLGLVWSQSVEALKTLQASLPPNTSQASGRHLGLVWPQWVRALKTLQASLPPNTSQVSGRHLGLVWSKLVNAVCKTEGQPTFHHLSGDLNAIIGLVPWRTILHLFSRLFIISFCLLNIFYEKYFSRGETG
jgi:hypothetical protein